MVDWDNTVQLISGEEGLLGSDSVVLILVKEILNAQVGNDGSTDLESVLLRLGEVVRHARLFTMKVSATELLIRHNLTGSSLDKGWSTKEDSTTSLDHYDLIGHSGNVSSASSAGTHYNSDLGDTLG